MQSDTFEMGVESWIVVTRGRWGMDISEMKTEITRASSVPASTLAGPTMVYCCQHDPIELSIRFPYSLFSNFQYLLITHGIKFKVLSMV